MIRKATRRLCRESNTHFIRTMFSLSESTLFFINRVVSSTTRKLSLGGLINDWANDVPAAPKSATPSSRSNTFSASHAATTPPSSVFTTSTKTSSKAKPAHIDQKQSISTPESNDVLMVSDDSLDDPKALEQRPAVLPRKKGKQANEVSHPSHRQFSSRTQFNFRSLL